MLTMKRSTFSPLSVASALLTTGLGISGEGLLPIYAVILQITPEAYQVSMEMLFETGEGFERAEHCRVRCRYEVLPIANLDYLEAAFLNALVQ